MKSYRLNMLAQVPASDDTGADMKRLRSLLCEIIASGADVITFQKMDMSTTELRVYTDASFANNRDLSSQLGWCIYAMDAAGRCNLLHWSSRKCRRVFKSTFAAELFALIQGYDNVLDLKHSMSALFGRDVQMSVYIDSKGVWDSVIPLKRLTENRLPIDIACLRQNYSTGELR